MRKVVFVTGGAGVVGRLVLNELRARSWQTRCLVHRSPVVGADEAVTGDLANIDTLRKAAVGADAVLHLAAVTHTRRASVYERVNVEGTRNLLAAAKEAGVRRFVYVSTRAIDPSGGAYSASKARAESEVRAAGVEHVILRLPELYGAGGREGLDAIARRAKRGRPIPVVGHGEHDVCPVFAEDAVLPLVAALERPEAAGKAYTLAGECVTVRAFAEACAAAFGSRSRVVAVPEAAVALLSVLARALPLPLVPDQLARLRAPKLAGSADAEEDLGFRPRPLRDGLGLLA